jgi:hypothetical protein
MKSFEDWLGEFRIKINQSIQRCRFDEDLVEHIFEEEKFSNYIFRKSGPDKQKSLPGGGIMIIFSPLITERVDPEMIRIKADLGRWADDPEDQIIDACLEDLGRSIVTREVTTLINELLKGSKEFGTGTGKISKPDVRKAVDWIHQNALGSYVHPNTLVVHPNLEAEFEERGDIIGAYRLPKGFFNGVHFSGIINGLNVFSVPCIPPNTILIYDKHEIYLRRTKVRVDFDNIKRPRYLLIEEKRKVWPRDSNSLAKVVAEAKV